MENKTCLACVGCDEVSLAVPTGMIKFSRHGTLITRRVCVRACVCVCVCVCARVREHMHASAAVCICGQSNRLARCTWPVLHLIQLGVFAGFGSSSSSSRGEQAWRSQGGGCGELSPAGQWQHNTWAPVRGGAAKNGGRFGGTEQAVVCVFGWWYRKRKAIWAPPPLTG